MKKILIILMLIISGLTQANDRGLITLSEGVFNIGDGLIYFEADSTFAQKMTSSYFALNPHLSQTDKDSISAQLAIFLSPTYVMPDGSDNLYDKYSDKETADWFTLFHYTGGAANSLSGNRIVTSGPEISQWIVEDSVYNLNTPPTHITIGDNFWIFLSISDSPAFILNLFAYVNDQCDGTPPTLAETDLWNYYVYDSEFDGTFPVINSDALYRIYAHRNNFDSLSTLNGIWASPNLTQLYFYNNNFDKEDINKASYELYNYFRKNAAVKDLTIRLDNMVEPTGGTNNYHGVKAQADFTSSGYTLTYDVDNTGGSITLGQPLNFGIPDTIFICAGTDYIFGSDLISGRDVMEGGLYIEHTCNIGSDLIHNYEFDEAVADTGYYDYKVVAIDANDNRLDSATSVIRLFQRESSTTDTLKGVLSGDSFMASGVQALHMEANVTGKVFKTYGTQPAYTGTAKTEAYSGQTVQWFIENESSPYVFSSVLDFTEYRTTTLGLASPLDWFIFQAGINDMANPSRDSTWIENNLIPDIQTMVDAVLDDGTEKIILSLQSKCSMDKYFWDTTVTTRGDQSLHIQKMQYTWKRLVQIYSGARYSDKVIVTPTGFMIDSYEAYETSYDAIHKIGAWLNRDAESYEAVIEHDIKYN